MIRGSRADVALPKFAFTCSPAGLNWAFVLMFDQFTVLNKLYTSQRICTRRPPPSRKFLNIERSVFLIHGRRKNRAVAFPRSRRPVGRANAAQFRYEP